MRIAEYRHIVIPVDATPLSDRVLDVACGLASSLGAQAHLIHVLEEPFLSPGPYELRRPDTPERRERLRNQARAHLLKVAEAVNAQGVTTSIEVRTGQLAEEIVKAAVDYGADLIVMGTHGRSGLQHLLTGSVAESVIRHARCPVLTVRDHGAVAVQNVA